jgi:ABC-type sugar transport system substrate-binding protein
MSSGLALAASVLAACGDTSQSSSTKVAFGYPYTALQVYKPLLAGAQEEAKKRGVTILQSRAALNSSAQISELNTWLANGVGSVVVLPMDLSAMGPLVPKAHKQKTRIIGYSTQIPGEDGSIMWNDKKGAQEVGAAVADWVNTNHGGSAKVGMLTVKAAEVGRIRIANSLASLKKNASSSIDVVDQADAADAATAYKATQAMLQAHPDISVILCATDDAEVGASRAMKQLGKSPNSIFLSGLDGSLTALQMIRSGEITGVSGALPLEKIGQAVTDLGANAAEGKKPTSKMFDFVLATNNNPSVVDGLIAGYGKQ